LDTRPGSILAHDLAQHAHFNVDRRFEAPSANRAFWYLEISFASISANYCFPRAGNRWFTLILAS
jgi:hypothetical protein